MILTLSLILLTSCSKSKGTSPMQFEKQENQRIVRINIRDMGAVTFRMFAEQEPEAVSRFIDKCRSGYYNGTTFFEVIEDYLAMGGKETSSEQDKVKVRGSGELYPFRGSLCANLGSDGKCSLNSFYLITLDPKELENIKELVEHKGYTFSDYIKFGYKTELTPDELGLFMEYGGAPWLYGHTAVLGQVIEGMEVIDTIITKTAEAKEAEEEFTAVIDSIDTD